MSGLTSSTAIRLQVDNLSCAGCAGRAEKALAAVAGVKQASVNFATTTATVEMEPADVNALVAALRQANYPAHTETALLHVEGMSCASCVGRVETALMGTGGVESASANLVNGTAQVRYVTGITEASLIARELTQAGYAARVDDTDQDVSEQGHDQIVAARHRALVAIALALPVFVLEMGSHLIPGFAAVIERGIGADTSHWVQFVLTTLCLIWPGRVFFARGVPALMRGSRR